MFQILADIVAGAMGIGLVLLLTRAPELRWFRLIQIVPVPLAVILMVDSTFHASVGNYVIGMGCAGFVGLALVPNISHYCGAGFIQLVDPQDWKSSEPEPIDLGEVHQLVKEDEHRKALFLLDTLLEKHPPTYEALLLKTRLLFHLGYVQETLEVLVRMLPLCRNTEQRLAVMEGVLSLRDRVQLPSKPPALAPHNVRIGHDLLLLPVGSADVSARLDIPPGDYEVESVEVAGRCWLKLAGKDWGNFEICWEAVELRQPSKQMDDSPLEDPPWLQRAIRACRAFGCVWYGRVNTHAQDEARQLLRKANAFIRRGQWSTALPILRRASALDPDHYEIAYRLLEAIRHCEDPHNVALTLRQIAEQSNWSRNELAMLQDCANATEMARLSPEPVESHPLP